VPCFAGHLVLTILLEDHTANGRSAPYSIQLQGSSGKYLKRYDMLTIIRSLASNLQDLEIEQLLSIIVALLSQYRIYLGKMSTLQRK
jgi:hypothetical protein